MNETSGATHSVWMASEALPSRATLDKDLQADVCIVGAGIAGLTAAYQLASEGRNVVVLEDGEIASGETSRTTAHLVNALDDRFHEIERLHGLRGSQFAAESHTAAIKYIEETAAREKIDCDFERLDGYLFVPPGESTSPLDEELAAAHRAGLAEVELVSRAPLAFNTGPCLRFPRQAQFHPLKYIKGLVKAVESKGGKIFGNTHAEEFTDGSPAVVKTREGRKISAGAVIVATNTPVNDWVTMHTKQAAYRTYVVALKVPKGAVTKALYWDTPDPYHYVRIQSAGDSDVLIVGGEDHKTGQEDDTEARFARLESWARERFSQAQELLYYWSGQVMEPVDGLAFIGRNPGSQNLYIATGDSGNGMTHGTIAGILLTDLILGRSNDWEKLYDPSRISLRAAGSFTGENLNMVAQYRDYATPGEIADVSQLAPDTGGVLRDGLKKVAVYRDVDGTLHRRSAVCPHLWGIVRWNHTEKTWDCPCHGSRFDRFGKVVNGPANSDLPAAEDVESSKDRREAA